MTGRPGASEPSPDATAMVGWAQLLHDVVARRLRPEAGSDLLAPSWDGMFDDALAEVMREMVADRLRALEPEELVELYRSVRGDEALLGEVTALVAERAAIATRERRLLALSREAGVAGRLRLADLDPDETLDIGLFDPDQPQLAGWRYRDDTVRRPLHRVLRVRLTDPTAGRARVVTDRWCGAVWAQRRRTPSVAPMTTVGLGTPLPCRRHAQQGVLAELTLHAPLALDFLDGDVAEPPGIVGYVRTLDGRVLLDQPPAACV